MISINAKDKSSGFVAPGRGTQGPAGKRRKQNERNDPAHGFFIAGPGVSPPKRYGCRFNVVYC